MIATLQDAAFDGAVIFTVFSQSALPAALLALLANIPLRLAHARENPYQLLTDWVPDPEPADGIRHEVERQLALVEHIGCRPDDTRLVLRVPAQARVAAEALLDTLGLPDGAPWVLLHPGASAPSRRYPPPQFAAAACALGRPVVVTGSAAESDLCARVCRLIGSSARNAAGAFDLSTFAALIERAPLVITNNTGPAHMAAALGTPVVDIYALTNPQHTPWRVPHRVLFHDVPCRNCFKSECPHGHNDCIRRVAPERVAAAARELLEV
jgi:lipopolysaccharide heptosyltransferase II